MTLTDTLSAMLSHLKAHPGNPARVTLAGGLQISLAIRDGRVHLQLGRAGATGPSAKELETVINHWPENGPIVTEPAKRTTWTYLTTSWPLEPGETNNRSSKKRERSLQ